MPYFLVKFENGTLNFCVRFVVTRRMDTLTTNLTQKLSIPFSELIFKVRHTTRTNQKRWLIIKFSKVPWYELFTKLASKKTSSYSIADLNYDSHKIAHFLQMFWICLFYYYPHKWRVFSLLRVYLTMQRWNSFVHDFVNRAAYNFCCCKWLFQSNFDFSENMLT